MENPGFGGLGGLPCVQVEFNAPLKAVSVQQADARTPSASVAALDAQAKTEARARLAASHAAKFRKETMQRIKETARAQREVAARKLAESAARKAEATGSDLITQRIAREPEAKPPTQFQEAAPQEPASQITSLRESLSNQAAAARMSMLSHCELSTIYGGAADVGGEPHGQQQQQRPPPPPPPPSRRPKTAGGSTAPSSAPGAAKKSMLRAVVQSAANADRLAAREARRKKEAEERKTANRAMYAEAVEAEAEAALRAEALREEVRALEEEARLREEYFAAATFVKQEQLKVQAVVEQERYFEALREKLRGEASMRSRPLPPMCSCGLDPLENHTENCARNCVFYKNPAAYGRALSGLFVRPIVLD
jgi:hypothetical protein